MWYIIPADRVTNWMALKVGNVLKMVTGLARGQFAKVKKMYCSNYLVDIYKVYSELVF